MLQMNLKAIIEFKLHIYPGNTYTLGKKGFFVQGSMNNQVEIRLPASISGQRQQKEKKVDRISEKAHQIPKKNV